MALFFSENAQQSFKNLFMLDREIHSSRSRYQTIQVFENEELGRILVLDDCIMLTDWDEFVYHELIAHPAMCIHPNPKKVLILGGGDGGAVRELARYPELEKIVLCEIDGDVVDVSRRFFPKISSALDDPRVEVVIEDGFEFLKKNQTTGFDIILTDSTDPVGPAEALFTKDFYRSALGVLRPGGVFVAQTESPWLPSGLISQIYEDMSGVFPFLQPYVAPIPTYPRGLWSWTLCSKTAIPELQAQRLAAFEGDLSYLNQKVLQGLWGALPNFYQRKLQQQLL